MQITIKIRYVLVGVISLGIFIFTTFLPALAGTYFIKGDNLFFHVNPTTQERSYDWFGAKPYYIKAIKTSRFMRGDIIFRMSANLLDLVSFDPSLVADPKLYAELVEIRDLLIAENKKHPRELRMVATLAKVYSILGDTKNALDEIEKALILSPNRQVLYWDAAQYFSRAGYTRSAVRALERVIEISPETAESYWQMTLLLLSVGKEEEAFKSANKSMEMNYVFHTQQEAELYKNLKEEYEFND